MKKCRNKQVVMSMFVCPDCDKVIYELPRIHRQREKGHIKDLFCPWCKTTKKCKEIRHGEVYKTLSGEVLN